ncbi:MAG: hypothetical protein M1574_04550 [Gammaproteobacteria bacterium]|nr:hypothetical protein [Gammaproteobacteria bacterium]
MDAHAVPAVGGHRKFDQSLTHPEESVKRRPGRRSGIGNDEHTVVLASEAELGPRGEHALRGHAANRPRTDLARGHHRSGRGVGHPVAGSQTGITAHHPRVIPRAVIEFEERPLTPRERFRADDAGQTDAAEGHRERRDGFDFEAAQGQELEELPLVPAPIDPFAQPAEAQSHT